MSHPNLPHTPFPDHGDRRPVARVHGVGQEHGVPRHDEALDRLPSDGRIVRVRTMERRAAEDLVSSWCREATPLAVPGAWRAWERIRADVASGAPRVQRLAVDVGDPVVVVNWSVNVPLTPADATSWETVLRRGAHDHVSTPPTGRAAHSWQA